MRKPLIALTAELRHAVANGTVVTGTFRQAYELNYAWGLEQESKGTPIFPTPDIHDFNAWLERVYNDLSLTDYPDSSRILLNHITLRFAFQLCVPDDDYLVHVSSVTRAWRTYVEWNLHRVQPDLSLTENGRLFRKWAAEFEEMCEQQHLISQPELGRAITKAVTGGYWNLSKLTLFGVDELSPVQSELLNQMTLNGCDIQSIAPDYGPKALSVNLQFDYEQREGMAIAQWVREQLSDQLTPPRIGVVVPSVRENYQHIRRQFEAAFYDCHSVDRVVNISGGLLLRETRLCMDLLKFLDWTTTDISYEEVFQLGCSPFLTQLHIPVEFSKSLSGRFQFKDFVATQQDDEVKKHLSAIHRLYQGSERTLHDWIDRILEMFRLAGWEAEIHSIEQQRAQTAIVSALTSAATLSPLIGRTSWSRTVKMLQQLLRSQPLKDDLRNVPVQVLSREESIGLQFDAMWIAGTSEDSWPPKPNPNPMIPIRVQRKAFVPRVTHQQLSKWAQRVSANWIRSAPSVVFSHINEDLHEDDKIDQTSRLLLEHPITEISTVLKIPEIAVPAHPWGLLSANSELLREFSPETGSKLPENKTRISTRTVTDQALCPFRAWAIHRLELKQPETPHRIPDAAQRGHVVHAVVEEILKVATTRDEIAALTDEQIETAINAAMDHYKKSLPKIYLKAEKARLRTLTKVWVNFESKRSPFVIEAVEEKKEIEIAGKQIRLRVDRIDQDELSGRLVLDVKTGVVSIKDWLTPRPKDAQMPLYALAVEGSNGIAYLKIKSNEDIKVTGIGLRPQGKKRDGFRLDQPFDTLGSDFNQAKENWHEALTAIVEEHKNGIARVDPIDPNQTCRNCHLMGFCRRFTDVVFDLQLPEPET